jgi:hypothetical protein
MVQVTINNCTATPLTLYVADGDQVTFCSNDNQNYTLTLLAGVFLGKPNPMPVSLCGSTVTPSTVNGAPSPYPYTINGGTCPQPGPGPQIVIS